MEYIVFIIYAIIVVELIFSKSTKKDSTVNRDHNYYRKSGVLDVLLGLVGILLINVFVRDKDIISVWSVWVGIIGFLLLTVLGFYYLYRSMTSLK